MEKMQNYSILETINETGAFVIYRALRDNEDKTYIIKKLKKQTSSRVDIARFRQEYEIIKSIDNEGVIKVFDCIELNEWIALVLEDFDGILLKSVIRSATFAPMPFLRMAVKLADALGNIHLKNIVHKDIKPQNILVNLEKNIIKIIDFGISQVITHENEDIYNPRVIEGALVYMSPEQTGRMNRSVDYRSDLYSLGVTFYEMLTGEVPFNHSDPMEVIHSHIAQRPVPPRECNQSIPDIVSNIIMKLLLKNAEERYQNAFGLMADLKECLRQYEGTGTIESFELATRDVSIKFNIPQMFFGRENEIGIITKSFERVFRSGKSEMLLVSGHPGIGKSALVNEINKPVTEKHGYFISGKYDQFRKDVPYSAIIQAFVRLTQLILVESRERINTWKDALLKELGPNGKIITEIIPVIEHIIGKQPDVPLLGPDESNNRFILVFKKFIRVFASSEHPLVLFLDDLQWADLASLSLVKNVMIDFETRYMFFMGTYRDTETNSAHPLMLTLDEMQKEGVGVNMLALAPLDVVGVNHLISNFLRSDECDTLPLAELIHKKTSGNPFFINQFLKALYDKKILSLMSVEQIHRIAGNRGGWTWDVKKISAMRVTSNVVELMAERIAGLSADTQDILKIAACVGNWFEIETLSLIQNKSIDATLADLTTAINEGFIAPQGQAYTFYHDRIQEAAYFLISSEQKIEMHIRIGKLLLERTGEENLNEKILYIVNQLNAGRSILTTDDERFDLAKLNLRAGIKAKTSAAYRSALHYLKTGIELINSEGENTCWKKWYDLTLSLYSEAAESAYLCTEYEEMDIYANAVLLNAQNIFDKAQVYEAQINKFMAQNRLLDAIAIGIVALKFLKIRVPKNPNILHIVFNLLKTKFALLGKSVDEICNFRVMKDPKTLLAMRLLNCCGSPAYWGKPKLLPLLIFKDVSLSLKYGNCMHSPYSFAGFGLILCGIGQIEEGYAFGKMSQQLLENLNAWDQKSRSNFIFNVFVRHWKEHLRETLPGFLEGYKAGLETGDLEFAVNNILEHCNYSFLAGKELAGQEHGIATTIAESWKRKTQLQMIKLNHQVVTNLQSEGDDACTLKGPIYNEETMLPQHISANDHTAICAFHYYKSMLCFIFHKYQNALEHSEICEKFIEALVGQAYVVHYYFYNSLTYLALCDTASFNDKKRYLKKAQKNAKKLKKWAFHAPMNNQHKYDLVRAEIARVQGQVVNAEEFYQKAIVNARENQYLNEEGIAYERAAEFYLKRGYNIIAHAYMNEAYGAYSRWGARAKLRDLENRYSDLIVKPSIKQSVTDTDTTSFGSTLTLLDIKTVMKAYQTLVSEIDLDKLLKNIMTFSIQNAGAERGFFILENEETHALTIEASIFVDKNLELPNGLPLEKASGLSFSIVNYVHATQEDVVLGNACEEGIFVNDDYIRQNRSKSILCTPITHKKKMAGILYLENSMLTNSFTRDRLELLQLLSSQAAISIENAKLYKMAITDGLTGLITYKHFKYMLEKEILRSERYKKYFSLIMFDIDHFKKFNDNYGHQVGDKVLKTIAVIIKNTLRQADVVARYGGEEFSVIMPETVLKDALIAAEKLRKAIEETELIHDNNVLKITISLGVAGFPDNAVNAETLIKASDDALYLSKENGRNKVTAAGVVSVKLKHSFDEY